MASALIEISLSLICFCELSN